MSQNHTLHDTGSRTVILRGGLYSRDDIFRRRLPAAMAKLYMGALPRLGQPVSTTISRHGTLRLAVIQEQTDVDNGMGTMA